MGESDDEPKGKKYPSLPALVPNQTHQVDMVGPCYLTGPIRFLLALNEVDAILLTAYPLKTVKKRT